MVLCNEQYFVTEVDYFRFTFIQVLRILTVVAFLKYIFAETVYFVFFFLGVLLLAIGKEGGCHVDLFKLRNNNNFLLFSYT